MGGETSGLKRDSGILASRFGCSRFSSLPLPPSFFMKRSRSVTFVIRDGSMPRSITPERLVWLVTITSLSRKGDAATTVSIVETFSSTSR